MRLFAFFLPSYREQTSSRIQRLLQRVRLLAKRAFQIADQIQPPIDEFRLGIDFTRRLRRFLFLCVS
jgi:hypothetical protein